MSQLRQNFRRNLSGNLRQTVREKHGLGSLLIGGFIMYWLFRFLFGDWVYRNYQYATFLVAVGTIYMGYLTIKRIQFRQMDGESFQGLLLVLAGLYLIYDLASDGRRYQQLRTSLIGAYQRIDGKAKLIIGDHQSLQIEFVNGSQLKATYQTSSQSGQNLGLTIDGQLTDLGKKSSKPYQDQTIATFTNDTLTLNRSNQVTSVYVRL